MLKRKKMAAALAASLFFKRVIASAKAAFFFVMVFFIMQAVFFPAFSAASGPAVFVEKAIGAQQTSIFISGSGLPEMRRITFTCTYSISHASIMGAIVSSPQPATAISVHVDTTASSLSVSISAASTIILPDNSRMVVLKLNNPSTGVAWPLTVVKALMIDKQGAGVEVPVSMKTSLIRNGGYVAGADRTQMRTARVTLFEITGRKISDSRRRAAPGCYLKNISCANKALAVSIR
jgi:hypothetical protein